MFVAIHIRAEKYPNGDSRSGFQVYHLSATSTYLGYVDNYYGHGWQEIRKHLPDIKLLSIVSVTVDYFEEAKRNQEAPSYMFRQGKAIEGE